MTFHCEKESESHIHILRRNGEKINTKRRTVSKLTSDKKRVYISLLHIHTHRRHVWVLVYEKVRQSRDFTKLQLITSPRVQEFLMLWQMCSRLQQTVSNYASITRLQKRDFSIYLLLIHSTSTSRSKWRKTRTGVDLLNNQSTHIKVGQIRDQCVETWTECRRYLSVNEWSSYSSARWRSKMQKKNLQ